MDERLSEGSANGWLVLASIGLLVMGTIAFVLGRLVDEPTFDFISIACSAAGGIALFGAVRASRRITNAGA